MMTAAAMRPTPDSRPDADDVQGFFRISPYDRDLECRIRLHLGQGGRIFVPFTPPAPMPPVRPFVIL